MAAVKPNRRVPFCGCVECDPLTCCQQAYKDLVAGITGVTVAGFPSSPEDFTSLNATYSPPAYIGNCAETVSGSYCEEFDALENFGNGKLVGSEVSPAADHYWYLPNLCGVSYPVICTGYTQPLRCEVIITFTTVCSPSASYRVDFRAHYERRRVTMIGNTDACISLVGSKVSSTIAGLSGSITLAGISGTDFVLGSVTATVV